MGWVIWRDKEDLPEELIFNVDDIGGNMPTLALNFSRPGGQIIALYYNFLPLGRDGYTGVQQACADTAQWLAGEIGKLGPLELVYNGKDALQVVCYKLKEGHNHGFTLYDLSERVRMRGWLIATYPLPANRELTVIQRILIRHGVSRDLAQLLLDDLGRALEYLQANPIAHSAAGPTFHH